MAGSSAICHSLTFHPRQAHALGPTYNDVRQAIVTAHVREELAFAGVVQRTTDDEGRVIVSAWARHQNLGVLDQAQSELIDRLATGQHFAEDLVGDLEDANAGAALLNTLRDSGWLTISVHADDQRLYTIEPYNQPGRPPCPEHQSATMSAFTLLRNRNGTTVAENAMSWADVHLHDGRLLSILTGLGDSGPDNARPLPGNVVSTALRHLLWTGHMVGDTTVETHSRHTRQWSLHELWFHHRSSMGLRGWGAEPFGATAWAADAYPPVPARRPAYTRDAEPLPTPDLTTLRSKDATLTSVIEDRRSCRAFDDTQAIGVNQLAELLYRCARTRSVRHAGSFEALSRPYPSGGSMHELELYPVIRHVDGLAAGMYHYDSFDHALHRIAGDTHQGVTRLVQTSAISLADQKPPQAFLMVTARPGRLMGTYEQMAYSLILKHVGILTQTVSLVATAMGLGCVAIGASDSIAFNEITQVDPLEECTVGGIAVGTPHLDAAPSGVPQP